MALHIQKRQDQILYRPGTGNRGVYRLLRIFKVRLLFPRSLDNTLDLAPGCYFEEKAGVVGGVLAEVLVINRAAARQNPLRSFKGDSR